MNRILLCLFLLSGICYGQTTVKSTGATTVKNSGTNLVLQWSPPSSQIFFVKSDSLSGSDSSAVNTWIDLSGGNTLYPVSSAPQFFNNIKNGFPAVRFTGSSIMTNALAADMKPFSFTVVLKFASVSSGTIAHSAVSGGCDIDVDTAKIRLVKPGVAVIGQSITSVSTGIWYALIVTYSSTGDYQIFINSSTADATGTNNRTFDAGPSRFGATSGTSAFLSADVLEMRKYNSVLSGTDISGWLNSVSARYAVP